MFQEPEILDSRFKLINTYKENKSLFNVVTYVYLYKNLHILIEYTVLKSNGKITKKTYTIDEVKKQFKTIDSLILLADTLAI